MSIGLKIKVLILSLIFPISGFLIGLAIGFIDGNEKTLYIYALTLSGGGILLDMICFYPRAFSFVFYRIPIPVLLFLVAYDISLFFTNSFNSLIIGISGLILGILMTMLLIRSNEFYMVQKRVLIIVYLFLSVLLVGLLQGIPVVNILLGVLAANYMSFRYMDAVQSKKRIRRNFIISAFFTSMVLMIIILISGFLLLNDSNNVERAINQVSGIIINDSQLSRFIWIGGILLVIIQFWLTYLSAWILYQYRVARLPYRKHKSFDR
jgi:hypothetical protein